MAATDERYYIGVDVGTGSARAALSSSRGQILSESTYAITTFRDPTNHDIFEQSSTEIWDSISKACRDVLRESKIPASSVKGIGFDATCSLAVYSTSGNPMSISPLSGWGSTTTPTSSTRDIILWADHRASAEARLINSTGSSVLKYVGGTMSLEMEIPKVLWLKRNMPKELFEDSMFFDLPDLLTYKATGELARSNCSLACKCSYVPPGVEGSEGWNKEFMTKIGLEEFVHSNFKPLGGIPSHPDSSLILTAGQPIGRGLSARAASELGLLEGTPVGSGVIDAYAGWVGTVASPMPALGAEGEGVSVEGSKHRLAAIAGTSTCHIVQSPEPVFVPGVWGPYLHAIFPGYWMNEGGQSSTGQLVDFIIDSHPYSAQLKLDAEKAGKNHFVYLSEVLDQMSTKAKAPFLTYLTKDYYVYPDFHGNRSPLADPTMRGMISGMALDKGINDLALRYMATCEAIALQTRQILESMNEKGHDIKYIFMSGGLVKSPLMMKLLADICNVPIQLPFSHSASVVLGSAMLGAAADVVSKERQGQPITTQEEAEKVSFGMKDTLWSIMTKMTTPGKTVLPTAGERERKLLQVKYDVFRESIDLQRKWRKATADALAE